MADPKDTGQAQKTPDDKAEKEHEHEEECLDEALDETFPASDPIAPQVPDDHS